MKYSLLFATIIWMGCTSNPSPPSEAEHMSPTQMREALIERNRTVLSQQRNRIEQYIKEQKLPMERSGTGMYYRFISGGPAVKMVQDEDDVAVRYQLNLLNGNLIYEASPQPEFFVVGKDDRILLGVHEAVKLMQPGDSIFAILPSHLAFGVGGDLDQVPTEAVIALHLKLLSIN